MENNKKHKFTCSGGPLDGKTLWLSIEHPYTLTFNLKNAKGYYSSNRANSDVIYWEAAK